MAVRVSSPVLIGRSVELARLRASLDAARDGQAKATVLAGEAGVGKTRLVTEFATDAHAAGARVLLGGCIDLGEDSLPYAPVVEALRDLVRESDPGELDAVLGAGRSELARLFPDLGPLTGPESPSDLNIGSAQGRLFELLLGVLHRLSAKAPVVLAVEDLHWSDRSTRDFLGFLIRNLRDSAVMLLLTYRSDELHRRHPLLPFLAELERSSRTERIELRPFDQVESADQLRAIAGRELDDALIESIHARSGGNAFFAEELLVAAGDDGRTELPQTLRDVLLARVSELTEPTQEFLRIASAAGQRVDPALLAAAAGMDEATLLDALRECVSRQVLVPDPSEGVDRYRFRHALLQEAIYDELLPGERTRLHSAFAQTLESSMAGDSSRAAEIAHHWYAAHDLPRALESAVVAGTAAEARYAFPEAVVQYERAIELWDRVPDAAARAGGGRIALLATLASVARFVEPGRALVHIQTAIRLAEAAGDSIEASLMYERLGRYAWIAGQGELSRSAYRTATERIPSEPPSEARARAVAGFAQIVMLGGRYDESRLLAEEALEVARAVGARDIEGHALDTRALDRAVAGEVDEGLADMATALAIAEEAGVVDDIGRAYANWIWILDMTGRLDEAVAVAERGIEFAERFGLMRFFGTHLLCNKADYLFRLGRWDESEAAARRSLQIGPVAINEILTNELLGRLAMARGRFDEAASYLHALDPLADRASDIQFVNPVRASLAQLALWQGRPAAAMSEVEAALRLIGFSQEMRIGEQFALGLRAQADLAELGRARRSVDQERQAIEGGLPLIDEVRRRQADIASTRPIFEPHWRPWLLLSEAEATRLHGTADPGAWLAAVERWDELSRPYLAAYCRWREAEARLAARGDRETAAGSLRSALETAERLGADPLAREVRALATRARLDLEPAVPSDAATDLEAADGFGLTAREREVLGLVALGRTNRQIAQELFISENTAGVHVSNILGKLGVTGRGEAAAVAHRLNLVAPAAEPA
ncbi:MAG: AAA family ATPase [Chloroflexota bacterium]